jgi:hypothetical protein
VTCGLGGAYLFDTHRLPDTLDLPSPESKMTEKGVPTRFGLTSPWPSKERSRRLVGGLLAGPPRGLPFRNPGFWRLAGALHGALLLALLFTLGLEKGWNLTGVLRLGGVGDVAWFGGQVLAWAAGLWVLLAVRPLTHLGRPRAPSEVFWPVLAEVVLGLAGMAALAAVPWPTGWPDWVVLGLAVLGTVIVTGLLGSYVFAVYVGLSRLPLVQGWQLSAQALEDWKGFLRLRIDPSGRLTIYPVVVDRVCHDWVLDVPDGVHRPTGSARPQWAGEPPRPYLVEPPIVVERAPAPPAPDTTVESSRAQPATTP